LSTIIATSILSAAAYGYGQDEYVPLDKRYDNYNEYTPQYKSDFQVYGVNHEPFYKFNPLKPNQFFSGIPFQKKCASKLCRSDADCNYYGLPTSIWGAHCAAVTSGECCNYGDYGCILGGNTQGCIGTGELVQDNDGVHSCYDGCKEGARNPQVSIEFLVHSVCEQTDSFSPYKTKFLVRLTNNGDDVLTDVQLFSKRDGLTCVEDGADASLADLNSQARNGESQGIERFAPGDVWLCDSTQVLTRKELYKDQIKWDFTVSAAGQGVGGEEFKKSKVKKQTVRTALTDSVNLGNGMFCPSV